MFNKTIALEKLAEIDEYSLAKHVGIEYLEVGDDYITARMPVDHRTRQPFGILHGGASVVLAETLGSIASYLCMEDTVNQMAVGLEINANHLRPVREGWVYGKVTALHTGRKTHLWDIKITNEEGKLVCASRITVMIVDKG